MGHALGKFGGSPTEVLAKRFDGVADDALSEDLAVQVLQFDCVASIEFAGGGDHPGGQERDPTLLKGLAGTSVDGNSARGAAGEGNPEAASTQSTLPGPDDCAHPGDIVAGVDQHPDPRRIGDHCPDP